MRYVAVLCLVLAACSSDKYVQVSTSDGRQFYARKADVERVDSRGMIDVENVLTGKRVSVRRDDCIVREASSSEVTRAKGNRFVYDK
jgi:hypothetical protein